MDANCGNCGYRWELQKEPSDNKDGPRCPECQDRDISIEEAPSERGNASVVFTKLEEGASLVDLVREEEMDPDEVEDFAEAYERLSDYQLLTPEEIENRETEAYDAGYDEGYKTGYEEGKQSGIQEGERRFREEELEPAKEYEYERGRNYGYQDGFDNGKEEGRREGYAEAREEFEAQLSEIRDEIDDLGNVIDDRIEAAENRGLEEGKRKAAEQAWAAGWEEGIREVMEPSGDDDMAAVYAEGLGHGILIGIDQGIEVGKLKVQNKLKSLSGTEVDDL